MSNAPPRPGREPARLPRRPRQWLGWKWLSGVVLASILLVGLPFAVRQLQTVLADDAIINRTLPRPAIDSSPALQLLAKRRTSRNFAERPLPAQVISEVLWAANGVNRKDGKRTAPSAHGWKYTEIYVFLESGTYLYDAEAHTLEPFKEGDLRALTGIQPFAKSAPLSLVYVTNSERFAHPLDDHTRALFGIAAIGAMVQNVYVYCAGAGLHTGVRADIERPKLHAAMGLGSHQTIQLAQSVGYPTTWSLLKHQVKTWLGR